MKKLFTILAFTLISSAAICGLWLMGQETVEQSSKTFHMVCAFSGVAFLSIARFMKGKRSEAKA